MGYKLVIAEKPMLARDIARAMCGRPVSETERLPISGNGYTVTACAGHLLELVDPEDVNPAWGKPWNLDVLPIEIDDWPKEPRGDKGELVEGIGHLLQDADCVIHAGDPDDEGQLIVDEVLDYLGYDDRVLRVYVNDNIEKNIRRAFGDLRPNGECRGAGRAAYARQMADMCFGVNETRLATKRLGQLFTVGRVQTPTLGLVVNRDEAIEHHVSRKYYELAATGACPDADGPVTFRLKPDDTLLAGEKHLFERGPLDALKQRLDGTSAAFSTALSKKVENPPLPYNLTVLLSDMSRRFGFTAAKTQQITQDLRDKYKAITYNRSDSQYLKEEHFAQAPEMLAQAMRNLGVSWELDYSLHSKAFNEKNVTAHHGIIPQEADAPVDRMTPDEAKVYTAIVERYAMQFLPPAVYDVSTSTFPVDEGMFTATCRRVRDAGFKATFGKAVAEDGDDASDGNPWLDAGEHRLSGIACTVAEKETAPPKPYTEGTLIADMASIAKYVKDPEVKAILKQKDDGKKGEHGGIGTTATRAAILEKLKERGYLEEVKGKLRSTPKARAFYHLLPPEIAGADVTARWWLIQQDIAESKADVNDLQRSVVEVFRKHQDTAYVGASIGSDRLVVGKCPLCGEDVIGRKSKKTGRMFYTCSSNKSERQEDGTWEPTDGCGFKLLGWCGKAFTPKQAEALLSGKQVPLRGCKSKKTSKTFDCKVQLKKDGSLEPIFDSRPKGKTRR
mgnify:CR=1 FL=1|jgi:DNA topoisomerase-3